MRYSLAISPLLLAIACGPVAEVAESRSTSVQLEPSAPVVPETTLPTVLSRVEPDYSAFPSGHLPTTRGVYLLRIDETGRVLSVLPNPPGHPKLDAVFVEAFSKWRFNPATRNGLPVAIDYTVSVNVDFK